MKMIKYISFIGLVLLSDVLAREQNTLQSSIKVTESQLTKIYIPGIKNFQPGKTTSDEVVAEIGNPQRVENNSNHKIWYYMFDIITDNLSEELSSLKKMIIENEKNYEEVQKQRERTSYKYYQTKQQWEEASEKFRKNFEAATIRINNNPKLYQRINILENIKPQKALCLIKFSSEGLMTDISIDKITEYGKEVIYRKHQDISDTGPKKVVDDSQSEKTPNQFILLPTVTPENPSKGQIYFNTTNNHFYGWNGTEWLQLDNPKINP